MKLKVAAILTIMLGEILSSGMTFSQQGNVSDSGSLNGSLSVTGNGHQDKVSGYKFYYFVV